MQYKQIRLDVARTENGSGPTIATLVLSKPKKFNAIGPRLALELDNVFDEIRHLDPDALVIVGESENFCAGGDLKVETLSSSGRKIVLAFPTMNMPTCFSGG